MISIQIMLFVHKQTSKTKETSKLISKKEQELKDIHNSPHFDYEKIPKQDNQ